MNEYKYQSLLYFFKHIMASSLDLLTLHTILCISEFYEDIDYQCGSLTIYSSVPDLVYYVQTGLQKIKDNT